MAVWKRLNDLSESDRHAGVSFETVGLWTYIVGSTDACGRKSADPNILAKKVLTLRAKVTAEWIVARLAELAAAGLVHLYAVDGRRYLVLHRLAKYNPPGAISKIKPEYPPPPDDLCDCLVFHPSERIREILSGAIAPQECTVPFRSSSSPVLEEDRTGKGKPSLTGDPVEFLMSVARTQNIPGRPETLRSYFEAWRARSGAAKVEQMLMESRGLSVIEIQDKYYPLNGKSKAPVNVKPERCHHGKLLPCRTCDGERA